MAVPEKAYSRKEMYYAGIAKGTEVPEKPYTREEMYLDGIKDTVDYIKEEVDKKSESIRLEYKNNKIYQGETEIDFEGIKALMGDHDNDIDLHADNDTIMRITAFADDAIEFSTTYITGGKVYVDRVIINSDNDIKFDELEPGDSVYDDAAKTRVKIGADAVASTGWATAVGKGASAGNDSVALGARASAGYAAVAIGGYQGAGTNYSAVASGSNSIAIGQQSKATGDSSIAIGLAAQSIHSGSVALGRTSKTTAVGEINVGSTVKSYGYGNSNYRIISGVHDPVNDQDAATKAYVDAASGPVLLTTAVENSNIMLKYNGSDIDFTAIQEFIEAGKLVEIVHETIHYRLTYHAHNGIMFFTGLTPIASTTYQIYQLSIAYQGPATTASAQFSKVSFSVTQG